MRPRHQSIQGSLKATEIRPEHQCHSLQLSVSYHPRWLREPDARDHFDVPLCATFEPDLARGPLQGHMSAPDAQSSPESYINIHTVEKSFLPSFLFVMFYLKNELANDKYLRTEIVIWINLWLVIDFLPICTSTWTATMVFMTNSSSVNT